MKIDERLENNMTQLELLTRLQVANERRFEEIGRDFREIARMFKTEHTRQGGSPGAGDR